MSLTTLQQSMARYCLEAVPDLSAADALGGDRSRWELYRSMVRGRFVETVGEALPRTRRAMGDDALTRAVDRFLASAPPTTRYVRELGLRFADFVVSDPSTSVDPAWLHDLVRLEKALLEAACAVDEPPFTAGEFAMDLPAGFAPSVRLLRVAWDVSREDPPEGHMQGEFALMVYRDPVTHRSAVLDLSSIAGDLMDAMIPGDRTVTECVVGVLQRHNASAGEAFMVGFADLLGDLMDRGVLLGSRVGS